MKYSKWFEEDNVDKFHYFFFKKVLGSMPAYLRIALSVPSGMSPG